MYSIAYRYTNFRVIEGRRVGLVRRTFPSLFVVSQTHSFCALLYVSYRRVDESSVGYYVYSFSGSGGS